MQFPPADRDEHCGRWWPGLITVEHCVMDQIISYCLYSPCMTACTSHKYSFNFPHTIISCMHTLVAFIIKNPINPIYLCSFTIKSRSAQRRLEKNLASRRDFCKPRPWHTWRKRCNSQFHMANHRDRGIMGYNELMRHGDKIWQTHSFSSYSSNKSR